MASNSSEYPLTTPTGRDGSARLFNEHSTGHFAWHDHVGNDQNELIVLIGKKIECVGAIAAFNDRKTGAFEIDLRNKPHVVVIINQQD